MDPFGRFESLYNKTRGESFIYCTERSKLQVKFVKLERIVMRGLPCIWIWHERLKWLKFAWLIRCLFLHVGWKQVCIPAVNIYRKYKNFRKSKAFLRTLVKNFWIEDLRMSSVRGSICKPLLMKEICKQKAEIVINSTLGM